MNMRVIKPRTPEERERAHRDVIDAQGGDSYMKIGDWLKDMFPLWLEKSFLDWKQEQTAAGRPAERLKQIPEGEVPTSLGLPDREEGGRLDKTPLSELDYNHIIEERIYRIARPAAIVTGQNQGIGMACCDAGRHPEPGVVIAAGLRQDNTGNASRVVLESGGHPVRGRRAETVNIVPES